MDDLTLSTNSTHLLQNPFEIGIDPAEEMYNIWFKVTTSVEMLVLGAAATAAAFLFAVLAKFKKLQTRSNVYFLHYSVCIVANHLLMSLIYLPLLAPKSQILRGMVSAAVELQLTFLFLSFAFASAPLIDCYLINRHYVRQGDKVSGVVAIYLLGLVKSTLGVLCEGKAKRINKQIIAICEYVALLVVVLVMNVLNSSQEVLAYNKVKHAGLIGTFIMVSYAPAFIFYIFFHSFSSDNFATVILILFVGDIPKWWAYSVPIWVTVLLGKCDKHIQNCYYVMWIKLFRQYQDENLDASSNHSYDLDI